MARRIVPAVLVTLLVVIHAQMWFGRGSVSAVGEMQRKLEAQKAANLRAQQANDRMASEVRDLKEGLEMVEEKARMELGMVKPNEIYVQVAGAGGVKTAAARKSPKASPTPAAASAASAAAPDAGTLAAAPSAP